MYQEKEITLKLLETSRFKLLPCEGTYFVASYAAISTENDVAFVKG
jgi:methionine aminotransferase